ncbi:MAG: glycoside hydrolase family 3 protein [Acidimicrobiales bacterium]
MDIDHCFMISLNDEARDGRLTPRVEQWIDDGLGGVVLFARDFRTIEGLAALVARLRLCRADLVIAVDEEGGDITRLEAAEGSSSPGNLVLGRVGDTGLTAEVALSIAAELTSVGVNMDLAPVADVNTNAANPVIGTRSFGGSATVVSAHVAAFAQGLQAGGVAACAKHFPGHGATGEDSHHALPVVKATMAEMRAIHLPPFAAAIEAQVAAIMTAHVVFPELDGAPATRSHGALPVLSRGSPATLSHRVMTGLLRDEMGFAGVAVSDAMSMAAIRATVGVARGTPMAIAAGVDLVCVDGSEESQLEARRACIEAMGSGELPLARVEQAAERVAELARRFPAPEPAEPARLAGRPSPVPPAFLAAATSALHVDASDAGLPARGPVLVLDSVAAPWRARAAGPAAAGPAAAASPNAAGPGWSRGSLAAALADIGAVVDEVPVTTEEEVARALAKAGEAVPVLVVKEAHRDERARGLVKTALEMSAAAIVVSVGVPADAALAPGRYIGSCGAARPNLLAVAELITGRTVASLARPAAAGLGG